jgi:hypothetical protein
MVCLRNICINTLHKGDSIFTYDDDGDYDYDDDDDDDDDDNDDDDDDDNNNNNKSVVLPGSAVFIPHYVILANVFKS